MGKGAPDEVKGSIQSQVSDLASGVGELKNTGVTKEFIDFLQGVKTTYGPGLQNLISKICGVLTTKTNAALEPHHNFLTSWTEPRKGAVPGELLRIRLDNLDSQLSNLQNQNQGFQFSLANSGPTKFGGFHYATPTRNNGAEGSHTFQHPFGNTGAHHQ